MHPDARRWDARYRARGANARFDADARLDRLAERLGPPARALDLACGTGGNALWLAARGWRALGVDISIEALRLARREAVARGLDVNWLVTDAANPPWRAGSFQLIVVTRYLDRALFAPLTQWLAPGGVLFYATFNVQHLARHPGFNPDYVLRLGELDAAFSALTRLDGNDGPSLDDSTSWLLARRDA